MAKTNLEKYTKKYERYLRMVEQADKVLSNIERLKEMDDYQNRIMARYESPQEYHNFPLSNIPSCDIIEKLNDLSLCNMTEGGSPYIYERIGEVERKIADRILSEKEYKWLINSPYWAIRNRWYLGMEKRNKERHIRNTVAIRNAFKKNCLMKLPS